MKALDTKVKTLTNKIDELIGSTAFKVSRAEKNLALEKLSLLEYQYQNSKKEPAIARMIGNHQLAERVRLDASLHRFNALQNEIAELVEEREMILTEEDIKRGRYIENDTETLGNCVRTASFESGTKEWMEARQPGIGGSDVGKILGLTSSPYEDKREILISKIIPITAKELENQNQLGTAAARGNSWEEAILRQFSKNHPELVVGHCKDSFVSKEHSYQLANVDGLLKRQGEKDWSGILEIKTSTRPQDWVNGIPLHYLAQGLWYLNAFGFEFGHFGVIIDSIEYREYYFDTSNLLPVKVKGKIEMMTIEDARPLIEEFQQEADEARARLSAGETIEEVLIKRPIQRGTPKSVTPSRIKHVNAFRQDTAANALKRDDTEELLELYKSASRKDWDKNFVVLDLETTRFSPRSGYIIEFGATERDKYGNEVSRIDELFGIPEESLEFHGTGSVEIHNISVEDIKGKPLFTDNADRILDMLKDKVLIAHNATFEKMWLSQHLPGFAELDIPVIDTMVLSTIFFPELHDSRLETLCGELGVPYTNGHRAFHDAEVTADAFFAFVDAYLAD